MTAAAVMHEHEYVEFKVGGGIKQGGARALQLATAPAAVVMDPCVSISRRKRNL